ncbi:MAG: 6-phosphofructokinase [Nitrospirales bacterium]|nr:6-phosphofructokinase [Nitrospirales bacterium]
MNKSHKKKIAILVGGGPAPGINSVIHAATIRSVLSGAEVVGVHDGFQHIMNGDITKVTSLTIKAVSRIHFQGGALIGTSRANPTQNPQSLATVLDSLKRLEVTGLMTIGGDDTAFSALQLEALAQGQLHVVHVPKTIDNDLGLPNGVPTFGFQTARHFGVGIVKNIMVDARTTGRWYLVVTMGRKAGHLALGIGKAAGATLTVIPEEFPKGPLRLAQLSRILTGAIAKRLSLGRNDGVAILAEGLIERLDPSELIELGTVQHDQHGHIRFSELDIGDILKHAVSKELHRYDLNITIVTKNIGYELRCADPIPYDMEYTRDLGYCAAQYLLEGGNAAMVAICDGHFTPIAFKDILDPTTGKTMIRMVDIHSEYYTIAREYMVRLEPDDFSNHAHLDRCAKALNVSPEEFRATFFPVVRQKTSSQKAEE